MKQERTIKQLLELMLEHQELFRHGLCYWSGCLYDNGKITIEELDALRKYIKENRPSKYSSFDAYKNRYRMYFWYSGNIKPRIKWIKKYITRL